MAADMTRRNRTILMPSGCAARIGYAAGIAVAPAVRRR